MNSQFSLRALEPTNKGRLEEEVERVLTMLGTAVVGRFWVARKIHREDRCEAQQKKQRKNDPFGTFSANEKISVSFHSSFMSHGGRNYLHSTSWDWDIGCSCAAPDSMMNFLDFSRSSFPPSTRRRQFFSLIFNIFIGKDMTTCTDAADEIYKQLLLIFPRFFIVSLALLGEDDFDVYEFMTLSDLGRV